MDLQKIFEHYPFLKHYALPIACGFFGLLFLGYGMIQFFPHDKKVSDMQFESRSSQESSVKKTVSQKPEQMITIDIEGAIVKPGVYHLSADSRVQDVVVAAGGLAATADRDKVAKSLNLAAKLIDGGKIYIPNIGDQMVVNGDQNVLGASNSMVNINTATVEELDKLEGIGQVTASKIISNRPYTAIEELRDKKIVGQKVFDQIKNKLLVN